MVDRQQNKQKYDHDTICVLEKQVSRAETSNYVPQIIWDVITWPCPWYPLLVTKSSIQSLYSRSFVVVKRRLISVLKIGMSCLTQWISKLPGSFEIHWVRQYLVNIVLFRIKDLWTYEMTVNLKSNLYVGHVIFLIFDPGILPISFWISPWHWGYYTIGPPPKRYG